MLLRGSTQGGGHLGRTSEYQFVRMGRQNVTAPPTCAMCHAILSCHVSGCTSTATVHAMPSSTPYQQACYQQAHVHLSFPPGAHCHGGAQEGDQAHAEDGCGQGGGGCTAHAQCSTRSNCTQAHDHDPTHSSTSCTSQKLVHTSTHTHMHTEHAHVSPCPQMRTHGQRTHPVNRTP